jgi:hypothetical protein
VPRKVFVAGEILTAADVNTNLMDQAVMSFAGTAARGSAIPSPVEGMVTYLNDLDRLEVYTNDWKAVGGILQVVSTTKTDTFSVALSDGNFSSNVTGLEAIITPSSTSSKILINVDTAISRSDEFPIGAFSLTRNGTRIGNAPTDGSRGGLSQAGAIAASNAISRIPASFSFLDSPGTTSAVTYGIQLYAIGTFTFHINRSSTNSNLTTHPRSASTITVMEVAG